MPKMETVMTMMADFERHPAHDAKQDTPAESTSTKDEEKDELEVEMPKTESIMPKTSNVQVVQNERKDLAPMRFQTNWRMCMDYQNFTWEPSGQARSLQRQDVEENGHDAYDNNAQCKERMKRVHAQLIQIKIFRLQRAHDQAIRLKKFEHGQKLLLYDPDDLD